MKNTKKRVFAYNLAKTIDNVDLKEVSGGSSNMTAHTTMRVSAAGPGSSADVVFDTNTD